MTMPELFEYPPTRSNRAKWALEELGVDYTSRIIDLRVGQHHSEDYKTVDPLEVVPAYRTDDYTLLESVAIVLQLFDEHPQLGLAPAPGTPARAEYYQWSVFASAELDPALADVMLHTMHLPHEQRVPEIAQRGRDRFAARAAMLSHALAGRDYLLGAAFSGADVVIGYCCNWAAYTGLIENHPRLVKYYASLQQRPAFQRVFTN
jgi:glutathione S-transferase